MLTTLMSPSGFIIICLVALSGLCFDVIRPSSFKKVTAVDNKNALPIVIVISFDGFRYNYLENIGKPTPNFDSFLKHGAKAKWMKNVFVTKTFPNHFTIATGLYEETHGIVGNYMFDPVLNDTFYMNNTSPLWWDNGLNTPIWIANEMNGQNRHSGCVMWSGCNVAYRNQSATYFYPYNHSASWNDRVDQAVTWLTLDKNPANLVMIYIEEPDAIGHEFGPDSEQVKEKILEADHLIGYLMDELNKKSLIDKANVIILSDHGMAEIHKEIEMDSILNRSSYQAYGHTPVWNILAVEGMKDYVYSKLLEGSKLYPYTLYKKYDIPEEYHFKNNRRVLDYLIVADLHYDLVYTKTKRNSSVWGQHGYNNSFSTMHPIFFAKGPTFKNGFVGEPILNLDVYPLLCHILGIKAPLNNGSFVRVKPFLKSKDTISNVLGGSWAIGLVFIICVGVGGSLTAAAISTVWKNQPPTIAYVTLRKQHTSREREMCSVDEKEQLLMEDGSTD